MMVLQSTVQPSLQHLPVVASVPDIHLAPSHTPFAGGRYLYTKVRDAYSCLGMHWAPIIPSTAGLNGTARSAAGRDGDIQ